MCLTRRGEWQKATRELSRVAFETNCRSDPVPLVGKLTNTSASWFRISLGDSAWCSERRASVRLATPHRAEPH
jgi:hypothetical protein